MDVTNKTPLALDVSISGADENAPKYCQVTAKATFQFNTNGDVDIDGQDPVPIYPKDEETELGILPCDTRPHVHGSFSVVVLAAAYNRQPRRQRKVSLVVGKEQRTLSVTGDRYWVDNRTMSEPESFSRMPITYDRAFGGSVDVLIDEHSPLTLSWPMNAKGKGFDPTLDFEGLAKATDCPKDYPELPADYVRYLPNIEEPDEAIVSPEDTPRLAGWGAVMPGDPIYTLPLLENQKTPLEDFEPDEQPIIPKEMLYRCHPVWLISPPEPGALIAFDGLIPEGKASFKLPEMKVEFDYVLGKYRGTRHLVPFMFVLLAEDKKFYLVYRDSFEFTSLPEQERSLCIRCNL